ncbi:MAG: 5-bromo-4-chloroindolyl phosphate hydrolysis family protein [Oscillibacter sp.]|nr:5-bromo-4-chloroindolyl phosphate hydrolysis family protein [Oscillibacter sp.]
MDFLKNFDGKKIPWWAIALGFVFMSPVGLALLLLRLFARQRQSTAANEPSLQQWAPMQLPVERVDTRINKPKYADATPDSSKRVKSPPAPKKVKTGGAKVFGVILFLIGALSITGELSDIITSLAFMLGGAALGVNAFMTDKEQKRFAAYLPIIGNREAMDVEELARTSGVDEKKVLKDLQKMLEQNYFGGDAYLNRELGYLFKSAEADQKWQEEHPDFEEAPPETNEGYSGILRDIRRANDRIADPVLSAKIDQLENLVGRILRVMEENPEKAKNMDTFMTYYLPTTQKLLDSYARFEAAGVDGENLRESKQKISSTMDMILKGFSRQLDELYKADAMDIDSDIRVMKTMLKRDGASASDDFGLGGSAAQKAPRESQ